MTPAEQHCQDADAAGNNPGNTQVGHATPASRPRQEACLTADSTVPGCQATESNISNACEMEPATDIHAAQSHGVGKDVGEVAQPQKTLAEPETLSAKHPWVVRIHEALRQCTLYWSGLMLAGYAQMLPRYTMLACWSTVCVALLTGATDLDFSGSSTPWLHNVDKALGIYYSVPVGLIAHDMLAGSISVLPGSVGMGLKLLMVLMCASCACSLRIFAYGLKLLNLEVNARAQADSLDLRGRLSVCYTSLVSALKEHFQLDNLSLFIGVLTQLLGSMQNTTVMVLVGGSFAQCMTPQAFRACVGVAACSFVPTVALWEALWKDATVGQKMFGKRRYIIFGLLTTALVPSVILRHAYNTHTVVSAESAELGCNDKCQVRLNELVSYSIQLGYTSALYSIGAIILTCIGSCKKACSESGGRGALGGRVLTFLTGLMPKKWVQGAASWHC